MHKTRQRRPYEPPRARDLSTPLASGEVEPLGVCLIPGSQPYAACSQGQSPTGGACRLGLGVNVLPQCRIGSVALVGCLNGGVPN